MAPEREKLGLLPGRPQEDDIRIAEDDTGDTHVARGRRRPADIYVPRAIGGSAVVLEVSQNHSDFTEQPRLYFNLKTRSYSDVQATLHLLFWREGDKRRDMRQQWDEKHGAIITRCA